MSSQIRKILICPFFGDFPPWMDEFKKQIPQMNEMGYDFLIDTDLRGFKNRAKNLLGIDAPIVPGEGKVWDYRGLLGYLYQNRIRQYEFWGHCDFDVVFGDVKKWVTDDFLNNLDIYSNHGTYMNGSFSLYRNTPKVNTLFKNIEYEKFLLGPPNGWIEKEFSRLVENSGLRYKYTFWQGNPYDENPNIKKMDGKLYQDGEEILMFHFRRSKKWPL